MSTGFILHSSTAVGATSTSRGRRSVYCERKTKIAPTSAYPFRGLVDQSIRKKLETRGGRTKHDARHTPTRFRIADADPNRTGMGIGIPCLAKYTYKLVRFARLSKIPAGNVVKSLKARNLCVRRGRGYRGQEGHETAGGTPACSCVELQEKGYWCLGRHTREALEEPCSAKTKKPLPVGLVAKVCLGWNNESTPTLSQQTLAPEFRRGASVVGERGNPVAQTPTRCQKHRNAPPPLWVCFLVLPV